VDSALMVIDVAKGVEERTIKLMREWVPFKTDKPARRYPP
jgi:peptide subunit release factor RF-3